MQNAWGSFFVQTSDRFRADLLPHDSLHWMRT